MFAGENADSSYFWDVAAKLVAMALRMMERCYRSPFWLISLLVLKGVGYAFFDGFVIGLGLWVSGVAVCFAWWPSASWRKQEGRCRRDEYYGCCEYDYYYDGRGPSASWRKREGRCRVFCGDGLVCLSSAGW